MKIYLLFFFAIAMILNSCSISKTIVYEYEIEIKANILPYVPKKFISYKNMLVYFTFNRYDSTIGNVTTGDVNVYTRLDSANCWLLMKGSDICYKISSFTQDFKVVKTDSTKNMMEGAFGEFVFDKDLKDTVVGGIQYSVFDSIAFNKTDSVIFRYFFVKHQINTVYDFLRIRHKNPAIRYAGFTMDDYKNKYFFSNLIIGLKETDAVTHNHCKAIYSRFKQIVK